MGKRLKENWLVVSTRLKNISQIGSFPQIGVKNKKIFETTNLKIRQWKKGSELSMMLDYFIRNSVLTPHESWLWLVSTHCKCCITLIISIQYHICKVFFEGYLPYYYPPFAISETPNTGPRNLLRFSSKNQIRKHLRWTLPYMSLYIICHPTPPQKTLETLHFPLQPITPNGPANKSRKKSRWNFVFLLQCTPSSRNQTWRWGHKQMLGYLF